MIESFVFILGNKNSSQETISHNFHFDSLSLLFLNNQTAKIPIGAWDLNINCF